MTDYTVKRYNAYSSDELLEAVQQYSQEKGTRYVSSDDFCGSIGVSSATVARKFGSWREFCTRAGLSPRYDRIADRIALLQNLDRVWQALGRQPRAKEMKQPLSPISISKYQKLFRKSWYEVCLELISWKTGLDVDEIRAQAFAPRNANTDRTHKTTRSVGLSLRYDVLKRDGFRCVYCGRSPAIDAGVQLHIDHKIPWSEGGETELENLQTLCSSCNLGKSNKSD